MAAFVHPEDYGRQTIYFYSDNTWKRESVFTTINNYTEWNMSGTYTIVSGDFTNGKLDFTVVEKDGKKSGWEKVSLEIKDGVFYLYVPDSGAVVVNDSSDDKYVKQ